MSEKSHVSMERYACLVCGTEYDTGAILIDKRLRPSLESYTTTGWGLCSQHQRLFDEGFVALVECDPVKSEHPPFANLLKPEHAYRTGNILHLKREAFARAFDVSIDPTLPSVFVEPGVIEKLQSLIRP